MDKERKITSDVHIIVDGMKKRIGKIEGIKARSLSDLLKHFSENDVLDAFYASYIIKRAAVVKAAATGKPDALKAAFELATKHGFDIAKVAAMSKDEIIAIWRAKNPSNDFVVETFDHSGANVENADIGFAS